MVLETKIESDIKYIYFNDETSLNAISSGDWKSLKSEILLTDKYQDVFTNSIILTDCFINIPSIFISCLENN